MLQPLQGNKQEHKVSQGQVYSYVPEVQSGGQQSVINFMFMVPCIADLY